MALTKEDLQAISDLLDVKLEEKLEEKLEKKLECKLKPIYDRLDTVDDRLDTMSNRLDRLEIKQDIMERKLDDTAFRLTSLEHTTKKAFKRVDDQMETLITVLEVKGILPQAVQAE